MRRWFSRSLKHSLWEQRSSALRFLRRCRNHRLKRMSLSVNPEIHQSALQTSRWKKSQGAAVGEDPVRLVTIEFRLVSNMNHSSRLDETCMLKKKSNTSAMKSPLNLWMISKSPTMSMLRFKQREHPASRAPLHCALEQQGKFRNLFLRSFPQIWIILVVNVSKHDVLSCFVVFHCVSRSSRHLNFDDFFLDLNTFDEAGKVAQGCWKSLLLDDWKASERLCWTHQN